MWTTRPASSNDLDAIVALRNTSAMDSIGEPITAGHWQRRHWAVSGIDLALDSLVMETPDGRLVGYGELTSEFSNTLHTFSGAVHPNYRGQGIGRTLVDWAESRVLRDVVKAPADARLLIQSSLFDSNQPGRALLSKNGYGVTREFVHLEIELSEPPAQPAVPDGVVIKPLLSSDWAKVGPALDEAFGDHWGVPKYKIVEDEDEDEGQPADETIFDPDYFNSPDYCFVAWAGQEVAGSCLCNAKIIGKEDCGYLGSLSVPRSWRRQGIGLALTLHTLGEFYRRGVGAVRTDTDADSFTRANHLYERAGMAVYCREIVYEKEIRPGTDWLKRNPEAA